MESINVNKSSMKTFFQNFENSNHNNLHNHSHEFSHTIDVRNNRSVSFKDLSNSIKIEKDHILIDIDVIYKDEEIDIKADDGYIGHDLLNNENFIFENSKDSYPLETYKNSAQIFVPLEKISGTFIEYELQKGGDNKNYIKIELKAKRNKIYIDSILNCFEYLIDKNFNFYYNKENLISYFYAFTLCQLHDNKREVLEKLLQNLSDENIVHFVKVVSTLDDTFLQSYSFWLIRYLINKMEKLDEITFNGYNFSNIIKLSHGSSFQFDDNRISYSNYYKKVIASANLNFLKKYYESSYKPETEKYIKVNNYFNMGKVLRRKSEDNLMDDYPHYYQLLLENDPSIVLYAIRPSENGNFIISKSIDDFSKYGINYVAEIIPNFWGTYFDVYDYGYDKSLHDKTPKVISKPKEKIGIIQYETNIMGESPRYFKIDIYHNKETHKLQNLKPEWNEEMDCYCLNFYGRVKKASAKNFQIIYPDDSDNILLQHGKVSKDEYNIDFREPFNFVFAFAISLVAIGKKRVVS